ncbi:MAG: hypothetical protein Q4G68_10100 [Planctomycetia bacterium]|nr:hypothetical protein [Planctomycetia bacterium]
MKRYLDNPVVGLAVATLVLIMTESPLAAQNWYRANLHTHTWWSDGQAFPEESLALYKDAGYQVIAITDHNLVANNPERWEEYGQGKRISEAAVNRFRERYPELTPETKEVDGKKFVRLKTFQEASDLLSENGQFLIIPGYELSVNTSVGNLQMHMNVLNVTEAKWGKAKPTGPETLAENFPIAQQIMQDREAETLLQFNHPDQRYFDNPPEWFIADYPFKFFEVCNYGNDFPAHPNCWTTDKFWDVINAFRMQNGGELIYGLASDDTHIYEPFYQNLQECGGGWVVINAPELTTKAVMNALHNGQFYASTGIELERMDFNPETKVLSIKVKEESDENYTITFIGTKKGFPQYTATVVDPADPKQVYEFGTPAQWTKPRRVHTVYPNDIGESLLVIHGSEASFTLSDDLLYVRAKIESSGEPVIKFHGKPRKKTAWTQPVR